MVERSTRPFRAAAVLAVLVVGGLLTAAIPGRGHAGKTPVVVGSKNFTEQVVLGEILAGALEHRGIAVDRRLNLGGTKLCHDAVLSGHLDVYVEYTGTALEGDPAPARRTRPRGGPARGARGLRSPRPHRGQSRWASTTRSPWSPAATLSQRLGMTRLSDLARESRTLRLGLFGEFIERADGLPA